MISPSTNVRLRLAATLARTTYAASMKPCPIRAFRAAPSSIAKGAGQYVTQQIFPRKRWRKDRETLEAISEAYRRMRAVCDMAELLHLAARLPLSATQEAARRDMLDRLLPDPAWTADDLAQAEETGLLSDARAVLTSFRDAALRR